MPHYSPKPLAIDLRPSRLLAAMLAAAGAGALALLLWMPLPAAVQGLLAVVLCVAVAHAILHDAWRWLPRSIVALQLAGDGSLRCQTQDGRWREAQVLGSSCVTAWLTVLNLRLSGRRFGCSTVLLPDSLDAEDYRQLRVWLRWNGAVTQPDA